MQYIMRYTYTIDTFPIWLSSNEKEKKLKTERNAYDTEQLNNSTLN